MKKLPKYRSHKVVEALKIKEVLSVDGWEDVLVFEEGYERIKVSSDYREKHNPKAGGYYVKYPDGYESWSPAEAFEEGYSIV